METIAVQKEDLSSWVKKLASLRKCNMEPEKCTHDRDENGAVQPFDYASVDMCLNQIVSEMGSYLK